MNIERKPDEFRTHITGLVVLQKLSNTPLVRNVYQEHKKNNVGSLCLNGSCAFDCERNNLGSTSTWMRL